MLRQSYFIGSFGFALLTLAFILGFGSAAARGPSGSGDTPPESPPGETVARSDDGSFAVKLVSPRSPYLFGRHRIEVAIDIPPGDALKAVDFFIDGHLRHTTDRSPFAFDTDFGEEIERHTILISATSRDGRTVRLSVVSRSANLQARVEVSLVTVPVAVLDSEGRFVENLGMSDFTMLEDGRPQAIVHFDRDPTPVSLVVALDASDSMKGSLWSAQKAANDFIASLPSFYKVCVLGFNDSVSLMKDFTYDRDGLAHAVNDLKPAGKTALYDTLRAAAVQLRGRGERRAAVLFTDGAESVYSEDERGKARLEESLAAAKEVGVTFYTIAFGPEAAVDLLRRIALETGGDFYDSRNPGALRTIYGRIADQLNHQYTLSYYPARPTSEGGWREIAVRVSRPDLVVRTRSGYLASR